ncbi:peptide chain release factor N(5)-glutamine methyltransferase [Hyphococcus sp.]|uniref:peptide chain release factor N(5)-glutamine methyltransferase n=1 Tax=Hyphococcus sp. TaxID=2038636 RepID=UPI003CCC1922
MPDEIHAISANDLRGKSASEALRIGAGFLHRSETPLLDARVLLKHALETDEAGLIVRAQENLSGEACARFADFLIRRNYGEPVAYITGVKEFWSLPFLVTPDVLIPRNDSECLIETAASRRDRREKLRLLDLGTGSGCLLCALLSEFENSAGVGVDHSTAAISAARQNAERLGLADRAEFLNGDWLAPVGGAFDVIIANPPYVPEGDRTGLARDVSHFEPSSALFAGEDGLDEFRRILPDIGEYLAADGLILMECGFDQTDRLSGLAHIAGFSGCETFTMHDLAGRPRGVGIDRRKSQKKD